MGSKIYVPLMPFKSPLCCFPSLFPHLSHAACCLVVWMGWERNEPLWWCPHSLGSCAFTHMLSLTPTGEPTRFLLALSSATEGDAGQVILFLLPSPVHTTHFLNLFFFFLTPIVCWSFSAGNLSFHKGSLVHAWLSDTVALQGLQTTAKRGWGWFTGHCRVHRPDQGLYAYYTMHWCVRLLPGLLADDTGSLSSHKGIFSHEWMPNCRCWKGRYKWVTSFLASCWCQSQVKADVYRSIILWVWNGNTISTRLL